VGIGVEVGGIGMGAAQALSTRPRASQVNWRMVMSIPKSEI
jgi:hypothetical protein